MKKLNPDQIFTLRIILESHIQELKHSLYKTKKKDKSLREHYESMINDEREILEILK